ncbi:MAG: tRNA (adenine-N1)-methyltransferase [Propionibacteriaceae bacterium]|jgi:tRNA (adenine57-N1/adenine58-N1)-methyltransferase|nr:tRNA (adenine-N1)-methyltransferase [Propionibacteriaceae bacterium]
MTELFTTAESAVPAGEPTPDFSFGDEVGANRGPEPQTIESSEDVRARSAEAPTDDEAGEPLASGDMSSSREKEISRDDVVASEGSHLPPADRLSGVHRGPLTAGERVSLSDPKGRRHSIKLTPGAQFHSTKGIIDHDSLIGGPEGVIAKTTGGYPFTVMRPLLEEFTVSMPRGATVIYPKDASYILMFTDIFPGARVLEAGAGSGALSLSILRAIGAEGKLYSYERREDFAEIARKNIEHFYGGPHPAWELRVGDLVESIGEEIVDRAILDMLAPWECIEAVHDHLAPGGYLCCYVATTTQMGRTMDTIRAHGGWTEPRAIEINIREWHAEGLSIRPGHGARGHTGFIIHTRRLADGVSAPLKRSRPAPGAYGPDYDGPRPRGVEGWVAPEV